MGEVVAAAADEESWSSDEIANNLLSDKILTCINSSA